MIETTIIMEIAIMIPGIYPAAKVRPREICAIRVNTIRLTPGGITGVAADEAAVIAAENALEYPLFSISGTSILDCIAQSAFAEPEHPPINMLSTTLTCARPPFMCPVRTSAKSIILSLMPP